MRFVIVIISSRFIIEKHIPGSSRNAERTQEKLNTFLLHTLIPLFFSILLIFFCGGKYTENIIHDISRI